MEGGSATKTLPRAEVLPDVGKDAADGAVEEIARIVAEFRKAWPVVRIIVRAGP